MKQFDLFAPPVIERRAELPAGAVFHYGGRALRIHKVHGTDAAAPVIVEELTNAVTLKGQFALWSAAGVARALANSPVFAARPRKGDRR